MLEKPKPIQTKVKQNKDQGYSQLWLSWRRAPSLFRNWKRQDEGRPLWEYLACIFWTPWFYNYAAPNNSHNVRWGHDLNYWLRGQAHLSFCSKPHTNLFLKSCAPGVGETNFLWSLVSVDSVHELLAALSKKALRLQVWRSRDKALMYLIDTF